MTALDHKTMFAWRPASFGRIRKVPPIEAARWRELAKHGVARRGRDWTHEEIDRLVTLLDSGADYTACARRLGRSRTAIQVKVKRIRAAMLRRPTVLTAREVAALIGKGCSKSIARWIASGILEAQAALCNGRRIWRICWDDLMRFLRNPTYWPCWDVARITDKELRAELAALRAADGPYLTQGEVAARYGVTKEAVGQWLDKGFLPAVHSGGGKGNRVIRARDLDGWIAPCERPRKGIPRKAKRRVVGTTAIVALI